MSRRKEKNKGREASMCRGGGDGRGDWLTEEDNGRKTHACLLLGRFLQRSDSTHA